MIYLPQTRKLPTGISKVHSGYKKAIVTVDGLNWRFPITTKKEE